MRRSGRTLCCRLFSSFGWLSSCFRCPRLCITDRLRIWDPSSATKACLSWSTRVRLSSWLLLLHGRRGSLVPRLQEHHCLTLRCTGHLNRLCVGFADSSSTVVCAVLQFGFGKPTSSNVNWKHSSSTNSPVPPCLCSICSKTPGTTGRLLLWFHTHCAVLDTRHRHKRALLLVPH